MTKTCYSSIFTVKNSIIKNNKSGTGGAIKIIGGKNGENGNASGDSTTATANNDKANIKSQSNMKIAKRTTARTYSVAPLIATVIIPFGAVPTIIILGLVALGLAAYIVYIMLKTFLIKSDKPQEVAEVYDILHNAYVTDEEAAKAEEEIVTAIAAETSKKDSAVAKAE